MIHHRRPGVRPRSGRSPAGCPSQLDELDRHLPSHRVVCSRARLRPCRPRRASPGRWYGPICRSSDSGSADRHSNRQDRGLRSAGERSPGLRPSRRNVTTAIRFLGLPRVRGRWPRHRASNKSSLKARGSFNGPPRFCFHRHRLGRGSLGRYNGIKPPIGRWFRLPEEGSAVGARAPQRSGSAEPARRDGFSYSTPTPPPISCRAGADLPRATCRSLPW